MPWLEEWKSYRSQNDGKLQDRQAIPRTLYDQCRRRVRDPRLLEDGMKVLVWGTTCQLSGRRTTPNLAIVVWYNLRRRGTYSAFDVLEVRRWAVQRRNGHALDSPAASSDIRLFKKRFRKAVQSVFAWLT